MRSYAVLVALAIASLSVANTEARYEKLNEYLIKSVTNDEVEPNMEAASNFLKEQENAKQSLLTKNPISDLKQFTALQQVIDDKECGHDAYEIIRANADAVDLHKLNYVHDIVRRVDKLIYKIIASHAERCLETYPTKYVAKREQIDPKLLEQVEKIGKSVINGDQANARSLMYIMEPNNLFNHYIRNTRSLASFANIKNALNKALVANSQADPNAKYARQVPNESTGKREVHKNEIKELTRKYLIEPCKQYEAFMGPDLFIPADYDGRVRNKINDNKDYYAGWSYFKICEVLTSNESAVLKEVVNGAGGGR